MQSIVIGQAREIYIQLTIKQISNYDTVKEFILKVYELVPEAYRQKKIGNVEKKMTKLVYNSLETKSNYLIGGALQRQ